MGTSHPSVSPIVGQWGPSYKELPVNQGGTYKMNSMDPRVVLQRLMAKKVLQAIQEGEEERRNPPSAAQDDDEVGLIV